MKRHGLRAVLESGVVVKRNRQSERSGGVSAISGSLLRGALARAYLQEHSQRDATFDRLFLNEMGCRFGTLAPALRVLPLTAAACKREAGFRANGGHGVADHLWLRLGQRLAGERLPADQVGAFYRCAACDADLNVGSDGARARGSKPGGLGWSQGQNFLHVGSDGARARGSKPGGLGRCGRRRPRGARGPAQQGGAPYPRWPCANARIRAGPAGTGRTAIDPQTCGRGRGMGPMERAVGGVPGWGTVRGSGARSRPGLFLQSVVARGGRPGGPSAPLHARPGRVDPLAAAHAGSGYGPSCPHPGGWGRCVAVRRCGGAPRACARLERRPRLAPPGRVGRRRRGRLRLPLPGE